jgi:hypothetical protein
MIQQLHLITLRAFQTKIGHMRLIVLSSIALDFPTTQPHISYSWIGAKYVASKNLSNNDKPYIDLPVQKK